MDSNGRIEFLAAFKPVQSAFQLDGDGDGGQLTLVFDRSQVMLATQAWAAYSGDAFMLAFAPNEAD